MDVSTYKPVEFKDVAVTVCDSTFAKECEDKIDQVIICGVVHWPCKLIKREHKMKL